MMEQNKHATVLNTFALNNGRGGGGGGGGGGGDGGWCSTCSSPDE